MISRSKNVHISEQPISCCSQSTVVICGGFLAQYEHDYASTEAAAFLMNGVNVLIYNIRGYGMSTGTPSEKALDYDLAAICNYLREIKQIPNEKIILKGNCMGGALAARCAARKENQKVVVMLDQTFAEFATFSETLASKVSGSDFPKEVPPALVAFISRRFFPNYQTSRELEKLSYMHYYQ